MKNLILPFVLLALLGFAGVSTKAQTFGSGVSITGSTNVPCLNGTTPITNYFYVSLPAKSITLSGISNTNEVFIGSYYMAIPGYTNAGLTNIFYLGSFTNSFLSGTNGGTWTTNFPGGFTSLPFPLLMGASVGPTNTNFIYVP